MTRKLRRFILVLGWVLLALNIAKPAYVQGPEEGWQVYTNSNHIRDLAFEGGGALGGGYTWAATFGGVVCYSANEYIKFTTLDGLAGSNVHAVAEDDGGRWWFGTGGGVSLLDDGGTPLDKDDDTWAAFTIADGLAGKSVRAISEDSEGRWWFGTWEGGVSVLDHGGTPFDKEDDTWIAFTESDGLTDNGVHVIAEDGEGRWWFGTGGGGVSVLDGGGTPFDKGDDTWITFAEPEGLADAYVIAIAEDGGGRLWFGTNGGGVSMLDHSRTLLDKGDDRWTTFTESNGLASNYVVAIAEDDGGRWWFGTSSDGVSLLDDGGTPFDQGDDTWTTFTESDGLARDDLMSIAKDGGGRWWFGTWGSGAGVLDDGGTPFDKGDDTWTTFATVDGLADSRIAGIVEDSEGRLWFGTWGSGVSVLDHKGTPLDKDDDTWTTFIESDGLASEHVHTIAEDSRGRWWFGMWGGVSVLDDGGTPFDKGDDTWATFTAANGLSHDWVGAIAEDSEERLWFGTENGISVLDHGGTPFDKGDDTWATFTTLDGLAHNIVLAIAEDSKGRLWFGTYEGGWSVLDHGGTPFDKGDDRWTTFTTADGLVDNGVGVIVEDSRGWFWFGTGDGVSVLDHGGTLFDRGDDRWATFTTADGLVDNGVEAIVEDSRGRWWFGTGGGVSVLDDGGTPFDKGDDVWTAFTTADGLVDNGVGAIVEDSGGQRWFGTGGGVGVLVDAVAPASSANSPAYASGTIPISWSANDGTSGVFGVTLWVRYSSGGTWTQTGLSQRGQDAGTFSYTPTQGDGTYYFATVAEDWLGNVEAPPTGSGDTSTVYNAVDARDGYETDDTCAQASTISTDGTVQVHNFHDQSDEDWVAFDATSGTTYLIEAQIPVHSPADVVLELYDRCDGDPQDGQDHAFSPGVRMQFQAAADGPLYLKLVNHDSTVYGANVAYHLSVRALDDAPTPGAVILVAGKLRDGDRLQRNIHHVTDAVYRLFLAQGYDGERIHYLATNATLDPDEDGTPDVDGLPTRENLGQAITEWAVDKVNPDRPFTLYLMDHGDHDLFYLNGYTRWLDPPSLDGWLDALEGAVPGVQVNVIIDACYSGSFIDLAQTISKVGRLVISSTGARNLAWASERGAAFSDPFLQALNSGMSLYDSFEEARWAVQIAHPDQTPWLDDDGDGAPNGGVDGQEATQRSFVSAGTLGDAWSPWVVWAEIVDVQGSQGTIEAEVRDDGSVSEVWAVIYPPSYQSPASGEALVLEDLPTVTLTDGNGDGVYVALYDGFDEAGTYRVVVYAVDEEGLVGRPRDAEVHRLYLPLVLR